MSTNKKFDLAIVGGGPAGLMAGVSAKERGERVVIFEKGKIGSKILTSGNGRCNLTNKTFNLRELVQNYKKNGDFLYRAFSEFGPEKTIKFFEDRGVEIKFEDKKAFPESDSAKDILEVFEEELKDDVLKAEVVDFKVKNKKITKALVKIDGNTEEVEAKSFLIATGGISYPQLGSDGFGFEAAEKMGHEVVKPTPGLTPIISQYENLKDLQGVALKNIEIRGQGETETGDLIFTHFGLSGPAVLNLSLRLSKEVGELRVKLLPKIKVDEVDKKLQEIFKGNKSVKNSLAKIFPKSLVEIMFVDFSLNKKANKITKSERQKIADRINNIQFKDCKLAGFQQALVTQGGVDLSEINSRTMNSKIIDNLFFAGEVIDLVGRTGGFNLQLCWSTGRLAGESTGND